MTTTGNNVVAAIRSIRRASIRWRCNVYLYRRGRAVVISHRPTVFVGGIQ